MTGFYKTLNTCTLGFVTVRHSSLQADFVKIPNKIMRQNIFSIILPWVTLRLPVATDVFSLTGKSSVIPSLSGFAKGLTN